MASTHATVLFDQADDPDVLFSNRTGSSSGHNRKRA